MNEMMITGWFYLETECDNNADAVEEFRRKCREVGINADNIDSVIIRNQCGEDITCMERV